MITLRTTKLVPLFRYIVYTYIFLAISCMMIVTSYLYFKDGVGILKLLIVMLLSSSAYSCIFKSLWSR